jgi:hypothetical protein
MTNEDKLAKEALEDLNRIAKTMPAIYDTTIKYWIRHAYYQGQIDLLDKQLKKLNG